MTYDNSKIMYYSQIDDGGFKSSINFYVRCLQREIFFNFNILNTEFYLFSKITNINNITYYLHDINIKHFAIYELYD
jgi:hypothetical protein